MFKSKQLLKPLASLIILQMILMPIAPVLAQELQNLNNFTFESGVSTTVSAINIIDPVVPPPDNVVLLNTENNSLPSTPSTLFNELLPRDIILSFPTSTVTTTVTLDNASSTANSVINLSSSTVPTNLVPDGLIDTKNRDPFLLDEMIPLKVKNVADDQELINAITVTPTMVPVPEIKIDDSLFQVVDEYKDEADLGNGKKALRIYPTPRPIFVDRGVKKVRPAGWSKFNEDPISKIKESKSNGYNFGIPFSGNRKVSITSGDIEQIKDGRQVSVVSPNKAAFVQQLNKDQHPVSSFNNIFEGINVNFVDKQNSRTKEIIITKQPANISAGTELIFWENYSVPSGAKVIVGGSEYSGETRTFSPTTIILDNKESMLIDGSIIYDSKDSDASYCDMSQLPLEQIINFDQKSSVLKIGLVVRGDYLIDQERVYPVIVDPSYFTCSGTGCVTDFYLKWLTDRSPLADNYLFIGYDYASGAYPCTPSGYASRHAVFKFNVENIPVGSTVTDAKLNLKYTGIGCGEYNSYINLEPKRITIPWDNNSIYYGKSNGGSVGNIRSYLTSGGTAKSLSYANLSSDCPSGICTWDLNDSMVQAWVNNPFDNYGFLVEPTGSFSSGSVPPASWSDKQRLFKFYSSDYSSANSPYLSVTYDPFVASKPDLTDSGTTISPNPITAGQNLAITFRVKNNSSVTSVGQSSVLKYYFNPSSNCYSTANLAGQITVPALGTNTNNVQSVNYTVSSGASGDYCFYYQIDANNNVDESDEVNNSWQSMITVVPAATDPLEPNNNYSAAYNIGSNTSYVNNALELTTNDQDWFKFTYNSKVYYFKVRGYTPNHVGKYGINFSRSGSAVTIETVSVGGSAVDTYLELYDSSASTLLTEDDDKGAGAFSLIDNYSLIPDVYDFVASNFAITDTKLRYSGLSDTITVNGYIQNTGNMGGNVNYILRLKNLADGSVFNLNNLSPSSLNLSAGYSQYTSLTGSVPNGMPYIGNYLVEVVLDSSFAIAESNENNNSANSTNNVVVQQYYTGGGGGGTTADTDKDTFTNVEEAFVGTNVNGPQSMNLYDPGYKIKKAVLADQPKNMVLASYKDNAMASINASFIFGKSSYAADPVNIRTGAFEFNQTDFALAGRGLPVSFGRTYNSKVSDVDNRIGNGWSDSYNIFYYQDPNTKNIQLYLGGAVATLFTTNNNGNTFNAPHGEFETLTKENGNLVYKTLDGTKYVFSLQQTNNLGVLKQIVDTKGNTVTLNYNMVRDVWLVASIVDASGRQINFSYPVSTDPLWDKIQEARENIDGTNKLIAKYTYDSNKNLIKVHQESNYSVEVVKNIDHNFTYDALGRMLTYTDPRGTVLYNEYDSTGRITKQYEKNPRLGSSDKRLVYELTYTDAADPNVAGSAHCTLVKNYRDANNHYDEYACYNGNELKIYNQKGNNVEKWEYDGNGMTTKYTDALNNVTNFTYDAKRRVTSQTQSDTTDWRTVITFEYENNFNRLTKKTVTVTALSGKTPPAPKVTNYTIDSTNGNIVAAQYPDGTAESFQYDGFGNVKKYTNKNNAVTDYVYDNNGNYLTSETIAVTQADGTAQTITKQYGYNAYGQRTSYLDPNGKNYGYGYDTRGNLRIETDPLSNSRYYKYDEEDHKISEIDALGHEIQYVFDTDINASVLSVIKVSSSGNITNSRQYDFVGNVVKEIDGNGNSKNYAYTAENWTLSVADAKRAVTNEYYANGWLKKQTDSEGRRTDYFYDSRGNKTETRAYYDATNYISNKFVYDGFNRVISQTDGKNNTTSFVYDAMDRLTAQTDAKGGVAAYFYDAVGNKIGERSPRASADATLRNSYGYSTAYFYDSANRLIKKVNADNKATVYIYDANGNVTKTTDNQNSDGSLATHITQYTYFDNNWKKSETDANIGTIDYTYYAVGTLKTKKSPAGLVTSYTYDDFNRLTKETDNAGLATNYTYDANNNKTSVTYPDSTKTQYTYDALNNLWTVKDALNGTRQFEYDGAGNKTKETNKLGKVTSFVYDKLNRLSQEINPASTATNYTYDNNSNRTAETVGAKTTAYEYDELNRNTKITYPGNKSESVTYDANGNIATKTDGKGQKIVYTYDKLNRQTTKLLPGGFTVQYVYDNWGNLTNLTDESGVTQYTYDKLNRNTNETKTFVGLAGKNYTVVRAYNADSQVSALTDSANRKFDYAYNSRGLLDNVKYGAGTLAKYTYSNFGKPSLVEYGNGVKTNLTYDSLNRVTNIATNSGTTTLFSQKYFYDAESNRVAMNDGSNSTTTYNYDDLEQLTNVNININGTNSALGYNYDIYGNRTLQTNPLSTANYTYTAGTNELDKVVYNNRLSITSAFDGNGSLTKETYTKLGKTDKEIVYTWDNQNRLAQINYKYSNRPGYMPAVPDNTLNFTYDDYGNRAKKQATNGTLTYYVNSGNVVLNEIGSTGTTTKSIVYGLSTVAEIDQNNVVTYIHQDTLGSTVITTNPAGGTVTKYEYDPFGQIIGQDGFTTTNYLYTGQEYDQESELYYYNARYYNPRLGRFISRDPFLGRDGDSLSRNGYTYVKNNPLKYVDPSGEEEKDLFSADGAAGFAKGFVKGGEQTLSGLASMFLHPIDTVVGIGKSIKDLAVDTYDGSKLIYNEISDKGFGGFINDVGAGLNYYKDQYNKLSGDQKGQLFGYGIEKIAEVAILKKAGKALNAESKVSTVYRVEGTPNTKVLIDAAGNVKINATSVCLYINCGPIETSINYLKKKIDGGLPNAQLKSFDVNKSFVDQLKSEAVDQSLHRFAPKSPFIVDKTTGINQFGLTRTQIQQLKDNIIQGSGKIIDIFK